MQSGRTPKNWSSGKGEAAGGDKSKAKWRGRTGMFVAEREERLEEDESLMEKVRGKIPDRYITPEELQKHATADDCWMALNGVVLDLTNWLARHPGGKTILLDAAGKDATKIYSQVHGYFGAMMLQATEATDNTTPAVGWYDGPAEDTDAPKVHVVKEFLNPREDLYEFEVESGAVSFSDEIEVYSSGAVKTSPATQTSPCTTLWISGQCASGENLAEMPVKAQAELALDSLRSEIEKAGGAGLQDIVMLRAYIVDIDKEKVGGVARAVNGAFRQTTNENEYPAASWVGCTSLTPEGALVQFEATALLPGAPASKL